MQIPIYLFSISSHPDAISVNSLDIKLLKPHIDFLKYDYFIVTSKQTSESLKQYLHIELKPALCVSTASAASYEKISGKVLEIGDGYGDNLVEKIKKYPKNTKWLYLRAKIVASKFVATCREDGYDIDEVIVYESDCSKAIENVKIQEGGTLIFTSPSSVKCFLKNHTIGMNSKVIVIGKTTAKALPETTHYELAPKTTIDACLKLV